MKIPSPFFVLLIVFLLSASELFAAPALYSAEVPVADSSPEARKASIGQAFQQVLIKASGHRDLKGRVEMEGLREHAEDYVQQFRYRDEIAETEGEPDKRWLWVAFEKTAVERALHKLGLSVWEQGRPEVLLWLAQESDGQRVLLNPEQDTMLVQALTSTAEQRGLPLLLPIMDLEDQAALRVSDIWVVYRESIERASARYGQQLILLGRLRRAGNQWHAKWTMLLPDRQQEFSSVASSREETVSSGIHEAMDWLADQYVPGSDTSQQESVILRFLGVDDFRDYSRLIQLFDTLDIVSEYAVQESSDDQLLVQAKVQGGLDILRQRLSLESELAPVVSIPDDETTAPGKLELSYRLR